MAKQPTNWATQDGFATLNPSNSGVQRVQQNNVVRTLENGTVRVLEDTAVTPKPATAWSEQ